MNTFKDIEDRCSTSQQEKGFNAYKSQIIKFGGEESAERFQNFYSAWCVENGLFNDINQSNF